MIGKNGFYPRRQILTIFYLNCEIHKIFSSDSHIRRRIIILYNIYYDVK